MFYDLSKLWLKGILHLDLNERVQVEDIDEFGEKISFNEPVEFIGSFEKKEGYIELVAKIKCDLKLTCSMCLDEFDQSFEFDVNETFSRDGNHESFQIPENGKIDLSEIVEENIVAYLPIQKRCSESCKGFCSQCGINLNNESCDCMMHIEELEKQEKEKIDPRLAKLQNFFNKN